MRDAIEVVYSERIRAAGYEFPVSLEVGMTPLGWSFIFHQEVEACTPEQFQSHALMAGSQLAGDGLHHGCTSFARLSVKDRAARQVHGHAKVHRRPRVFVVHALGWKGNGK